MREKVDDRRPARRGNDAQVYDTGVSFEEGFTLEEGKSGIYACGIIILQGHIGHARQAIAFDIIVSNRRVL